MPSGIVQACSRCRTQKRKCDRRLPTCSLCKRLKRTCSYPMLDRDSQVQQARPLPVLALQELSCPNIRDTLYKHVSAIVGDGQQVQGWATVYFRTIHQWLPVISQTSYSNRLLPARIASESADFCLLNLTMYLACTKPVNGELSSKSQSLYLLVKSLVGTLEAVGINSIEMLQSRLLITIFEVGHGLFSAAYISSGASVRAAIELGINAASSEHLLKLLGSHERSEEAQRTWSAIIVADRYTTLQRDKGAIHRMEPLLEEEGDRGDTMDHSGLTQIGSLTELTQASELLEKVLVHVRKTASNHEIKAMEALQILEAVLTFLAQCSNGSPARNLIFSGAVAVCRSAMLEILEYGSQLKPPSIKNCNKAALNVLPTLVNEIAQGAASAVYNSSLATVDALPVFIPHCIYKAAMVYLQSQRQPGQGDAELIMRPLMDLLTLINTRWTTAGHYLKEIERLRCVK